MIGGRMGTGQTPSSTESVADTLAGEDASEPLPSVARGTMVGRYVVLEEAGHGGVGVVYAAYDAELDRRIALKLLRAGPGPRERHQLALLNEARSMAKLSHPNVVAVHDVGIDRGRVWVAMEFIDGRTLRQWLREAPRSPRDIVEVYIGAGRGLGAAHAAGITHRDFKPENVLLGADRRARVTDFGLAHASVSNASAPLVEGSSSSLLVREIGTTTAAPHVGTPQYMAPEQLAGQRGDAKSDQFAFCVALFEALWGARPFRGVSISELVGNVLASRIDEPPGVRVSRQLRQVVLRGLAIDPEARHADMDALVHALARAIAKPGRAVAMAGAAAGTIALAVSLAVANRGQDVCTGAAMELEGLWDDDVRTRVDAALLATEMPYAAHTSARVASLLDDWRTAWQAEHLDACEATAVRKEQSEELMDRRMACLTRSRDQAQALVEILLAADATTVERAIGAIQALPAPERCSDASRLLAGPAPPRVEHEQAVVALRTRMARAQAFEDVGAYARALELARAIAQEADALGDGPLRAEAHTRAGTVAMRAGAPEDARASLERGYFLAVEFGDHEVAAEAAAILAWVVCDGLAQREAGGEWAKHALAQARHAAPDGLLEARALAGAAVVANTSGRFLEALDDHQRALAIRERLLAADHLDIAQSRGGIANALKGLGRVDEALVQQGIVADIRLRALGPDHPLVAAAYVNLAGLLLQAQREVEAERWLRQALEIDEPALGPEHPTIAIILENLGIALDYQGRDAEALPLYRRALAIREKKLGPSHPQVAQTLSNLATVLADLHRHNEALELQRRAVAIDEQTLGAEHPDVAVRLMNFATSLYDGGHGDEALTTARRAWDIGAPRMELGDPQRANTGKMLAAILVDTGHADEAIPLLDHELPHAEGVIAGEMRLVLARALLASGGNKARVRELAAQAAREFADGGARGEELAKSLETWIATAGAPAFVR